MPPQPSTWTGKHAFEINGSGLHEDTLRIVANYRKSEQLLRLTLPTLCITYADMAFQNAVGGLQTNYPASAAYGPAHFDPPVVLTGGDIEKFTYIRGAQRVEIGPRETIVEFPCWRDLVIPRLRIDRTGAPAQLAVGATSLLVDTPLRITVKQYADGRHVGGVRIEKRHPQYVPPAVKPVYDLWIRVVDGVTRQPLREAVVEVWHWDERARTPYRRGDFALDGRHYTNGQGVVDLHGLRAEVLQWYTVSRRGWRVAPRCLRPLPQQPVRLHMTAWPMIPGRFQYQWQAQDRLEDLAQLTGTTAQDILHLNGLASANQLTAGMQVALPCYAGTYRPERWEKLAAIAQRFGFKDTQALAEANGLRNIKAYDGSADLKLPDWHFFHARKGDSPEVFDKQFGLPAGSSAPAHRVHRPRAGALLSDEVVAVPAAELAAILAGRRNP